jgi:hypothetical protein
MCGDFDEAIVAAVPRGAKVEIVPEMTIVRALQSDEADGGGNRRNCPACCRASRGDLPGE